MTGRQRYRANALIKKLCANYDDGNCLLLDGGRRLRLRTEYILLTFMQVFPQCGASGRSGVGSGDTRNAP